MQAILFDFYGVIVTDGWQQFQTKHFANDEGKMRDSTDLQKQFDRGYISYKDFLEQAAQMARTRIDELDTLIHKNVADKQLLAYISKLKQSHKIGLLSNAGSNFLSDFLSDQEIALFDEVVLSGEIGHIKPSKEAYLITAKRLNVSPKSCVFIDDREENCEGARMAGMRAVRYTGVHDLRAQLA